MPAAEEAAMRGQRRGMRGLQHPVPARVDHRALLLRVGAPEQEHQALALAVERLDDMVGEAFPALALVRAGAAFLDREHRVEQQYAAPGPRHQVAVVRSEEHTSELQSLMRISYAVFCLKKKIHHIRQIQQNVK